MKKIFLMLPLMVAIVALVGCKKSSLTNGDDLKEDDPYYNSLNITETALAGIPEPIPGTETRVKYGIDSFDVVLANFVFYAWGDGITLNMSSLRDGDFCGKGFMIKSTVTAYLITSGKKEGYYLSPSNGYHVEACDTPTEGFMAPGVIDPATYGDWINMFCDSTLECDSATIFSKTYGTHICYCDFTTGGLTERDLSLFRGNVNKMVITTGNSTKITSWGADVTWSNTTSDMRYYGFLMDADTKTLVKPYDYKSVHRTFHEDKLNAPQAPSRAPRTIRSSEICMPLVIMK